MTPPSLDPELERAIVAAAQALRPEAVAMLSELVGHASLLGHEQSAQARMKAVFAELGLGVHEFEIDDAKISQHPGYSPSILPYAGRRNVVGLHRPLGATHGKSLIFNGHIDVVPVGAEVLWTKPPFEPWVDGDKLHGRGAADMKAGIVAYTMAYRALRAAGLEPAAAVTFQSVVEEECTGNGALACLVEGYRADGAIIPEPMNGIMACQMGVLWFAIEVFGKPVHASVAHTGVGAIDFTLHLFGALKQLEARWNEPSARYRCFASHAHPVNFNLGKIQGGEWASSVPTTCRADIRIGFYPDMSVAQAKAEVEAVLAAAHAAHPARDSVEYRIVYEGFQADGFDLDLNDPVITELMRCHEDVAGRPLQVTPFTGTTDAKFFNLYGNTPAICYGPHGESYHGIDEWVSIASMVEVSAVLAVFMARWCGVNRLAASR
jgi:acetylornithine deacetylase